MKKTKEKFLIHMFPDFMVIKNMKFHDEALKSKLKMYYL